MKVGIVTVHDSTNIGSYMQALGLQEVVKQHGDTPYFIKTRSLFSTLCLFLGYNTAKSVRSFKSFVWFCLSLIKHPKMTAEKYKKYKTYRKDWMLYENIISVKSANAKKLDVVLLGSDEIWNVQKPTFQNPYFYGIGLKAGKKAGYAVSLGKATKEELVPFEHLRDGIRELDSILYRDDYTKDMLKEFGIESTERICDPTLQADIRKYMKKPEEVDLPKEDYIAVYSYRLDKTTIEWIKRFAKENGLKIAAISLPQSWCDFYINCSPSEFGAALSKARYVYTNTFHGTIFSSLYHTKYVALATQPKVMDVLKLLGLEDHALPEELDYEAFSNMLKRDYDFSNMEEKIVDLRKASHKAYEKLMS
ncbi:MAG: polysaccharide pyruvyl transferase family protein [Clostridia bacterium]|nr:polysaccharide pyruvyl transferase family protein [Clostridia bacterium]